MSETFLILRRNERDMIKMYIGLHVKDRLFLSDFKKNLNFLDRFSKKYSDIKFHENPVSESRAVPCGRTDRQTDTTKPRVAFCNFVNAPNIDLFKPKQFITIKRCLSPAFLSRSCCMTRHISR